MYWFHYMNFAFNVSIHQGNTLNLLLFTTGILKIDIPEKLC